MQEASEGGARFHLDRFSAFDGVLTLSGWIFVPGRSLVDLTLVTDDGTLAVPFGLPSEDVETVHGAVARASRFGFTLLTHMSPLTVFGGRLVARFDDGSELVFRDVGRATQHHEPAHALFRRFVGDLRGTAPGAFLEIGSRARSGIVRRDLIGPDWRYVGLDITPGENVDVVGDAHALSRLFAPASFRAAMAISVLEHLVMPWKFALELNRVLEPGGLAFFLTHQTWSLHEVPWDFWRFSQWAWPALFNTATGFEIVDAGMAEPAYVVPVRGHDAAVFTATDVGYLASSVLVKKIGETGLRWDVDTADVLRDSYPRF